MDIGVDQAKPRNDMIRDKGGKYIYKISESRDEIDRFNRNFDQYKERRAEEMKKRLDEKLAKLNKPEKPTPIYEKPIGEILIETKDSMFSMLDDCLKLKFKGILSKDDRMFHLGVVILLIVLILVVIYLLRNVNKPENKDINIIIKMEKMEKTEDIAK